MRQAVALRHVDCRLQLSFHNEQTEPIRLDACLVQLDQDAFACEAAGDSVMATFFWRLEST